MVTRRQQVVDGMEYQVALVIPTVWIGCFLIRDDWGRHEEFVAPLVGTAGDWGPDAGLVKSEAFGPEADGGTCLEVIQRFTWWPSVTLSYAVPSILTHFPLFFFGKARVPRAADSRT